MSSERKWMKTFASKAPNDKYESMESNEKKNLTLMTFIRMMVLYETFYSCFFDHFICYFE